MMSIDQREWTALHKAVSEQNIDITRELIRQGADINACTCNGNTPLLDSIDTGNLEIFCMLLYYNTDVTIRNETGLTALTYAIQNKNTEMAQLLIPYYDNFNYTDEYNNSPLQLAVQYDKILAFELLELGADVNGINDSGYCVLDYILMKGDVELFKKVWPKFDYQILLKMKLPLPVAYLHRMRNIPTSEWLEGFYLILECPIALDLIQHFKYYNYNFFHILINDLNKRNFSSNHITNIISICLSLGVKVKLGDLDTAIKLLGFQEDFEMLLYAAGNLVELEYNDLYVLHKWYPLLLVVLGMEDFNIETLMQNLESNIESNRTLKCIGFFSISYSAKLHLFKWCSTISTSNMSCQRVLEKINRIPEFPTLLELSRNQSHKFIRQTYKITKPYHFQDAVKRLHLPQYIKDVIRFKIPIYH